jgi:hypothetical protein
MATTTRLGLPYPVAADSADVPRDIGALANKLETFTSIAPPLVTTLPVGPVDGQECYYQNAAMATEGIIWHLRYRAAGGTYKWEFLGGQSLFNEQDTGSTTSVTSWSATTPGGPQITVPLAGVYSIGIECAFQTDTIDCGGAMSYAIGAAAPDEVDRVIIFAPRVNSPMHMKRTKQQTFVAGVVVAARYRASFGGIATFGGKRMEILPMRVG